MATKIILEDAFPYTAEKTGTAPDGVTPIYDRAIGSASYRAIWKVFFSDGIGDIDNDFKLTLTGGFGISIEGGRFFADGVTGVVNRNTVLQVEAPPTDVERIDRIVIQNNYIDRYTYMFIKKGDTDLIRNDEVYELGLYDIRVKVNAAAIQTGDITDLRGDRKLCGLIMTSNAAALVLSINSAQSKADDAYKLADTANKAAGAAQQTATGAQNTANTKADKSTVVSWVNTPRTKIAEYLTAGTYIWTVPAGVYFIDVFIMGGGGASKYVTVTYNSVGSTGGGGAGYIKNIVKMAVTPGQQINLVVGAGGTTNTNENLNPSDGGTTSFSGVTAAGGKAGSFSSFSYDIKLYGMPGAGSSPGGVSGGSGITLATSFVSLGNNTYLYHSHVSGQGTAALNINDLGRTYGRGGQNGNDAKPTCDVDVGSGGDGGFAYGSGQGYPLAGNAGKAGCVMIYAYNAA